MTRMFTPAEANRTLPLVKRIVADILERGQELRQLSTKPRDNAPTGRVRELEKELTELMQEVAEVGCDYKDFGFEAGLVDFPSQIDGDDVLLCWKSDEAAVTWYHGLEDGFAGRQPIPADMLE